MSLEIKGKLIAKLGTQQISEKYKKQEFVIEISEVISGNTYTNYAKMQLVQNKCALIDTINIGSDIKVHFNIKGNKWEKDGKVNYITNLDAWKIEVVTAASLSVSETHFSKPASPETNDDLPF